MWLRRAGWQTETYWTFKESVEDPSRSMGIRIFDPSLGSGSLVVRATQASVIIRYTLGDCGWAKDIRVAVIRVQPVSAAVRGGNGCRSPDRRGLGSALRSCEGQYLRHRLRGVTCDDLDSSGNGCGIP